MVGLIFSLIAQLAFGAVQTQADRVYSRQEPGQYYNVGGSTVTVFEGRDICASRVPRKICVQKFGENDDVDGEEDVWLFGGTRTHPVMGGRMHNFYSTDANDTAAGTGCRTLRVEGVNGSYALFSEDLAMSGTTHVTTTNTISGINSAYCTTAGTGLKNAGSVYGYSLTEGTTGVLISPGYGRTLATHYYVPLNHTLYIDVFFFSVIKDGGAAARAIIEGRVRVGASGATPSDFIGRVWGANSTIVGDAGAHIEPPFAVPGGSIAYVKVREVSAADMQITAGFSGILEAN